MSVTDNYPQAGIGQSFAVDIGRVNDAVRLTRYNRYLTYDQGKHDVGRLPGGIPPVIANYARVFVRKGASYLFPEPVTVSVDPPGTSEAARQAAARAEQALAQIAEECDLGLLDLETAIDAGVMGDGAYKVTWDASVEQVRIVPVDVQTLSVDPAADNYRQAITVRQTMQISGQQAADLYQLQAWQHPAITEEWTADTLTLKTGKTTVAAYENPYGFIPFVIFPNSPRPKQFWGESDLEDLMNLNQALDRRLSIVATLLEFSGNPVTVLTNIDASRGLTVTPGAVWELPEGTDASVLELLPAGTIEQHMQVIQRLYQAMHDVAETPRPAFGEGGTASTGVALEFLLQPLIQKTRRKRQVWTHAIMQRSRMALLLMQRFGGLRLGSYRVEDLTLRVVWPPIVPTDKDALVQDETALFQAGLTSRETAIRALGLDPETEQMNIAQEDDNGQHAPRSPQPDPPGVAGHGRQPALDRQPTQR